MIVDVSNHEVEFNPFEITITVETKDEATLLYALFSTTAKSVVNRQGLLFDEEAEQDIAWITSELLDAIEKGTGYEPTS